MYRSDLAHANSSLAAKLEQLYGLRHRQQDLELSFRQPYLDLLHAFGDPHLHLPPVIHFAGTNGKGSTLAMIRAMLEAANLRVHSYTSPHLVRFNERIVLAGAPIADDELEALIDEALAYNDGQALSFFEITTAIAFAAFMRKPADILLLETGLGGRLDCTNVIAQPLLSVITAIGLDHQEFLGETLEAIATEKAGIMKAGAPCLVAHQRYACVTELLRRSAEDKGCPFFTVGESWPWQDRFRFAFQGQVSGAYPQPALHGAHQLDNAATALCALQLLQDRLPTLNRQACEAGLQRVTWPARLQDISAQCLPEGSGWQVFLDGGHNADAAQMLLDQIITWKKQDAQPVHLICTMMRHKDARAFLTPLAGQASSITLVPLPDEPDSFKPDDVLNALPALPLHTAPSFDDALQTLTSQGAQGHILICGSLYLAGHVLQKIGLQA